jgi:hypothetical protein
MRALIGPLLVQGAYLVAGMGVLSLIGVLRGAGPGRVLAAGGLAYLCGLVAILLACNLLVVVGVPFTLGSFGIVALVLALPALLRVPRQLTKPPALAELGSEGWFAAATLAAVGLMALAAVLAMRDASLSQYDAWNLWTRKALFLVIENAYHADAFRGTAYGVIHPDYPLLLPLLEATHLKAAGVDRYGAVLSVFPPLLVAFTWAAAFVASRVTRPALWAPVVGIAALASVGPLLTGYADVPLGYLLCLAALLLGIWLEREARGDLAVATLMLAGAAELKNEGLVGALLLVGVAGAALVLRRAWPRLRELAAAAAGLLLVAVLPWQLWLSAHDFHGDISVKKGLSPGYLIDHWSRVRPSVHALFDQITTGGFPALFVAFGIALAVAWIACRGSWVVPFFYVGAGMAYFASLIWAYWISPLDISFHLMTSVDRVALGVASIALAGVLHMSSMPRARV